MKPNTGLLLSGFGAVGGALIGSLLAGILFSAYGTDAIPAIPLLLFGGSGFGAGLVAKYAGRKGWKWGPIAGILGVAILLVGLSIAATLPGKVVDRDVRQAVQDAFGAITALAAVAGWSAVALGTSNPGEILQPKRNPTSPLQATTVFKDPIETMKKAYALIDNPTRDMDTLVAEVGEILKTLEAASRSTHPQAVEARNILLTFRARIGGEFLTRAAKSLSAAEFAMKAQRGAARQAATRAEEYARHALSIIDAERDPDMHRRGNQYIQAARLIQTRKEGPDMLSLELTQLERDVQRLAFQNPESSLVVPGQDHKILTRIVALRTLCEVTKRFELVQRIEDLTKRFTEISSTSTSTRTPTSALSLGDDVLEVFDIKKVEKELKAGGFGRTFLAIDNLDRRVVIKTLHDKWLGSASVRQAFKREGVAEARFQHEGVPAILRFKEVGGRPFKVMDYVSGGSLRDKIREWTVGTPKGPDPVKAVRIVSKVVDVLVAFQKHFPGGVHRDLKPENILLDADGNVKVTDFGLAHVPQLIEESTAVRGGSPLGTLLYMSPEQARGETDITPKSDVYSVGVMLHELLTGQYPYDGKPGGMRPSALRDLIRRGELSPKIELLPEPARAVIQSCLHADPSKRPTVDELRAALSQLETKLMALNITESVWTESDAYSNEIHISLESMQAEEQRDDRGIGA